MRVFMYLRGTEIGRDAEGNRYFIERWSRGRGVRRRRWVLYPRDAEASSVPAEWHAWLHHTTDAPLTEMPRYPWQRPHLRNATGTASAYRPPGHDSMGGQRAAADGDYESWAPAPPQMSAVPRIGQALETEQQP
ncbi:NADH:ubiquinone oxidoreductase subunit NDUFA12 [Rhodovastum atsumiense]